MTESDDDVEYCAKCGYSEFNEDGTRSHDDEEEYDHNFEYEEVEEPVTLADVKEGLDVLDKGIDVWNKLTKKPDQPSLDPNKFKYVPSPPKISDLKLPEHSDKKAEKRHKETIKWTKIGIAIGAVVTIILGTVAIIFN